MKHSSTAAETRRPRRLSSKRLKTKAKKAKKAEPKGVNLFDRIARDRRMALLDVLGIARMDDTNYEGLKTSFHAVRDLLGRHWDAVENTLHSTLLGEEDSNEIHAQVLEEREFHHICNLLANELIQIPASDPRWHAKFALFSDIIGRYVEKSKGYLADWKRALGPQETKLLGVRFARRLAAQKHSEGSSLH